ncbi:MAG: tyrosine-protein kinase Etk/Wzc [Patiriisocius sp.]|jgi:tyrosine-protein kinase Etk/Wzc
MENPNNQGIDRSGYLGRLKRISDQNEFGRLLHVLKKSVSTALLFLALSVIAAYCIIRWTSPIYEASSIIQLGQNDKANKILQVNQLFEEDDMFAEIEFIQSKLLIDHTVKSMPISVRYFTEGQFLTHEKYPYYFYTVDSISLKNRNLYGGKIYINFSEDGLYNLSIREQTYQGLKLGAYEEIDDLSIKVSLKQEVSFGIESQKNYFKVSSNEMLVNEFQNQLRVSPYNSRAKSIVIKARGQNPILAKDFVNKHVDSYMRYGQNRQNESAENILSFITNQLDTVSKNLQDAERLLSSFRSENNLIGKPTNLFKDIDKYDNESVELEYQENILEELERITRKDDKDIDIYNLMAQIIGSNYEVALKGMLGELNELLKTRERYKYDVTEENESIKTLNYRIGIQKKLIQESIISLKDKLQKKKDLLNSKKNIVEKQFVNVPSKEVELARYQRLFNISEKYYNLLLEKRTEYKISKAGYVSKNKILSRAKSDLKLLYPKKSMIYSTLIGLGLVIGALFIFLRYLRYDKINSLNDIVKYSGGSIKTLGLIPQINTQTDRATLLVNPGEKTILVESLRSIKTNLQLIDSSSGPVSIGLTSTISGEGKTFVSINLGATLALSDKKVIVLDLDLRKPKIHDGFGVTNSKGISNVIVNELSLADSIRKSDNPNLDFITSGPLPSNPFELINKATLIDIVEELKKDYDFILIDTPPIGLVSDAYSVLNMVDYPIYIFKSEVSRLSFIQNVDRLIHENKLQNMTTLLNCVDISSSGYTGQIGYGYGYVGMSKNSGEYFDEEQNSNSKSIGQKIRSFFR